MSTDGPQTGELRSRPDSAYPLKGDDLLGIASVIIAEYTALRDEIGRYHDHQKQIMNFAFLLFAAMFGVVGAVLNLETSPSPKDGSPVLLVFPLAFALLALLYSDRTLRIVRVADYLHNHLRLKADLITGEEVWQWEVYKRRSILFNKRLALLLDRARWLVFVLPSLVAFGLYFSLGGRPTTLRDCALVAVAILSLLAALGMMFLAEETTGVEASERTLLDS